MSMTREQLDGMQRLGLGVLEAVEEAGELGAPGGILYAAMQAHGASLSQFQSFMGTLTGRGMLTLDECECYHITEQGREFKKKLEAKFGAAPPSRPAARSAGMGM